jgi:ureidoglycolate lyase
MTKILKLKPLTREAFAPYGDVVQLDGSKHFTINQGMTERFHNLANIDVESEGGKAIVSIFQGQSYDLPIEIKMMERHPLGSQLFYPLNERPYLVVVGQGEDKIDPSTIEAFWARADQGVNYARNVWHHPLLALEETSNFMIVDRDGPGNNLEEVWLEEGDWVQIERTE